MKKQIVTIVLGTVAMLGTATTLFAQNGTPDRRLPACDGRRSRQSGFCTRTSSVRSYGCSARTSRDQAPQKDLYVSEALKEWLLTLLTQSGGPGFRSPGPFSTITGFLL